MGCQADVWIGVRVRGAKDLARFGFRSGDPEDFTHDTGVVLFRKDRRGEVVACPVVLGVHRDDELGLTLGGADGTVFGMRLTSRYRPGFLDCDYEHGNGDFLQVDPWELAGFLSQVRVAVPDAGVFLVHSWY